MKYGLLTLLICTCLTNKAQNQIIQTIRGKVVDKLTSSPLPGVVIQLKTNNAQLFINTTTNEQGFFTLEKVPIGRQSFLITYLGYNTVNLQDIVINAGKESFLNVDMEESMLQSETVEIDASKSEQIQDTKAANMKTFSVEETERYAGSRQDPARMASNFAGVQGTNDSRNDIVVRGNSPAGLLWRLDEINIPNPNHFALAGSAGGPTAIINNKYLANSQFYTGAFPANYGNALGGVFDLKMRNGNNQKHERTFQFGILGTELAIEGPINKENGSSYFVNYRYSTLDMLSFLKFNFGTSAVPQYQDGAIRLSFPTKKAGHFTFSAIGGFSTINLIFSALKEKPKELYGDLNRDQKYTSSMGVGILNHAYNFNSRTFIKTSLAYSGQFINAKHELILRNKQYIPNDTLPNILDFVFYEGKTTLASYVTHKINTSNYFKVGFFANLSQIDFYDKVKVSSRFDTIAEKINDKPFKERIKEKTSFALLQPYITYTHKFCSQFKITSGLYSQLLTINNSFAIEPRLALEYVTNKNHVISLAYGLHSQMHPTYIYYAVPDSIMQNNKPVLNTQRIKSNMNLDFTKSHHVVLGYEFYPLKTIRTKFEIYYQYLYNAPVYATPSGISLLNNGSGFTRFFPIYNLQNAGTGYNYGLEMTLEKSFSNHFFLMYSASIFESKYTASNNKTFDTDFNGNYAMNLLAGSEIELDNEKKKILSFGLKITYGGGKRYSPANIAASNAIMEVVPDDNKMNTLQFDPYNRFDFRVSYKINTEKVGYEFTLDLVNVLNTKNILALSYSPDYTDINKDPLIKNYQLGLLPLFYFKVDF